MGFYRAEDIVSAEEWQDSRVMPEKEPDHTSLLGEQVTSVIQNQCSLQN